MRAVRDGDLFIADLQRIQAFIEAGGLLLPRSLAAHIVWCEKKFGTAIVVVRAEQGAAAAYGIFCGMAQRSNTLCGVVPGGVPALRITSADALDGLQNFAGIGAAVGHLAQRAQREVMIGLVGEVTVAAAIRMEVTPEQAGTQHDESDEQKSFHTGRRRIR